MIKVELPTLISKLNEQSKIALEQAASLAIESEHSEVTINHVLLVLLDNPIGDVREIFRSAKIEHELVKNTVMRSLPRDCGHQTYPAFSPLLVELLQDAWLIASTELQLNELRSGAIFLAALVHDYRYLDPALATILQDINRESLKRTFFKVLQNSSETMVESDSNGQKTNQASLSSAQTTGESLSKYCTNLTEQARNAELDPVLCRDQEIDLMVDILCRRRKSNPMVVGDAGVGKSAVVEGLALRIANSEVPSQLANIELMSLDLGLLQAGAAVKGEFEKRLKAIIEDVKSAPTPVILFIDEAHTLIGAGNQEGAGDAANLLKPALARGEVSAIAATTWKEYKKYIEKDPALSRRFQLVKLDEPSAEQAIDILRGLSSVYEASHQVLISDDALIAAAHLSDRYLTGRQLPDKAIDVLDTACARVSINISSPPAKMTRLATLAQQHQLELNLLQRQEKIGMESDSARLEHLAQSKLDAQQQYDEIKAQWERQKDLVEQITTLRAQVLSDNHSEGEESDIKRTLQQHSQALADIPVEQRLLFPNVDEAQIAQVIADWTGVPASQMRSSELQKLTELDDILRHAIKGQDHAISLVHSNLLTARADLRRAGRPKGAFLLVGPSGVGKTQTVVELANELYGGKRFLTTINMSEYQEKHSLSRLIGSPPGYVGYGEGGVLSEAIRKMPYSVVLLDEVEKAHPEVLNLFYQAFDKGEFADGEGRLIDCQNIVFFMTSNLGYQCIVDHANDLPKLEQALYPELAAFFKPALLARMEIVPYLPLDEHTLIDIVNAQLDTLAQTLSERYKAGVEITPAVADEIIRRSHRSENGARMLEAVIEGQMLPSLSLSLLNNLAQSKPVTSIHLDVQGGDFVNKVA